MSDSSPATTGPRAAAFVRAYARLAPVAHVPELRLHQADEPIGLWELTEGEFRSEQPPPFWAFAWAGGQALARYLLDHPDTVAGRRVLDLATGSGLVALAAARAGAATVRAVDIDPVAVAAVELNAQANGVTVRAERADLLAPAGDGRSPAGDGSPAGDVDVVLAGDVFYSQAMADRMLRFLLGAARAGARVLVGDPDRAFLPRPRFDPLASYQVPVPTALESVRSKHTTVWQLRPPRGAAGTGPGGAATGPGGGPTGPGTAAG
ncbi:50S ribosomal protein L11 methyltransferase [Solwaraspora sp. WMMD1047]|uniref:class I SAM-dependent methyltransferase n=1 Tax=Solwaraspora sp. WMMD1047 TaxID=3016102 RepID=UPI002417E408|nr:50S ribosomal protein L11 methyltransferase [Solwaraspora sp. WMMD1047]MDG4829928.1 50S ribosomal protein L11 methyltransferase [Solwaraspora sp. WMMD1047]